MRGLFCGNAKSIHRTNNICGMSFAIRRIFGSEPTLLNLYPVCSEQFLKLVKPIYYLLGVCGMVWTNISAGGGIISA